MPKPPEEIPHREARNRVAHLVVDLVRIAYDAIYPERRGALAADFDIVLVACAIVIGHTEGRPMTASKIAHYLGMPRTTVLRRLDALVAADFAARAGKSYVLSARQQGSGTEVIRQALAAIAGATNV
jgi:hypothetical protein